LIFASVVATRASMVTMASQRTVAKDVFMIAIEVVEWKMEEEKLQFRFYDDCNFLSFLIMLFRVFQTRWLFSSISPQFRENDSWNSSCPPRHPGPTSNKSLVTRHSCNATNWSRWSPDGPQPWKGPDGRKSCRDVKMTRTYFFDSIMNTSTS
jgi:hypothetical protein